MEQWEDKIHNYMYHVDESQIKTEQKKPNSKESILYDSTVPK